MNKICIIIPYFGKFHEWFEMFLGSAKTIEVLDFVVYTDDLKEYNYPSNFEIRYTTFEKLEEYIKNRIGQEFKLRHPYKLCDYRPLYGFIFSEHLKNYSYWGYCDVDMIFGDVDSFFKKIDLKSNNYDRLFKHGCFTIYKNNDTINNLFRTKILKFDTVLGFKFINKTTYPVHFDEIGMNIICYQEKVNYLDINFGANVHYQKKVFTITNGKDTRPEILYRFNGKLFVSYLNHDQTIEKKELMFVHIMNRSEIKMLNNKSLNFIITHEGFFNFDERLILKYFEKYGNKSNLLLQKHYFRQINNKQRNKSKVKLFREIKAYPINFVKNLIYRFYAVYSLRKLKF